MKREEQGRGVRLGNAGLGRAVHGGRELTGGGGTRRRVSGGG